MYESMHFINPEQYINTHLHTFMHVYRYDGFSKTSISIYLELILHVIKLFFNLSNFRYAYLDLNACDL